MVVLRWRRGASIPGVGSQTCWSRCADTSASHRRAVTRACADSRARTRIAARARFVLVLLLLLAAAAGHHLLRAVAAGGLRPAFAARHLVNPVRTLANWGAVQANGWEISLIVWAVLGLLAYLVLMRVASEAARQPLQLTTLRILPESEQATAIRVTGRRCGPPPDSGSRCRARRSAAESVSGLAPAPAARSSFRTTVRYVPGDDLRHVDWAAYARSEVLAVRLYREEVAPRIDLVLDISRSMGVTEPKRRAYGELAGLLACACASTVADSRIITTSASPPQPLHVPKTSSASSPATPRARRSRKPHLPLPAPLDARRRQRFPVSARRRRARLPARARLRRRSRSCSSRSREEAEPEVEGRPPAGRRRRPRRARSGASTSRRSTTIAHGSAVCGWGSRAAARRAGARFAHVVAGAPIRDVARQLAAAGVLEAA